MAHRNHTGDPLISRQEIARLKAELKEANRTKEQLLAVLSHELRNPMSAVLAGIEVLQSAVPGDSFARRALEILECNAKLQARLINDLLDLSRTTRGKMPIQRMPVPIDAVVQAVVQAQRDEAEQAGLTIRLEGMPRLWVEGDSDRLQQVVLNLVVNAIKFTPAGGEIRVRCVTVNARVVRIIVEDTGIGISRDLLPHLFEMFRQGEVSGRRAMGLGIGLALVKSISEMHGGRVWAESEGLGQGSRFTVELSLIPAPAAVTRAESWDPSASLAMVLVEDSEDTRPPGAEPGEGRLHRSGTLERGGRA